MENVYKFILNESHIKEGDNVVLGVSGGPDSMVLLYIFNDLKKKAMKNKCSLKNIAMKIT